MWPEQLYLSVIDNLSDGVYFVDKERKITFWNTAAEEITGYKKEEIIGKYCNSDLLNHIDRDGRHLCALGCPLYSTLIDGKQRRDEVFLRHKNSYRVPVHLNIFPIRDENSNEIIGAVQIFTQGAPIAYKDDLIERLSDMAMNDQLTGLANRIKMESYLSYRFSELKRFKSKFCVAFMDIDNFSEFNDTYGHEVGDAVLKSVARSVSRNVRASDLFARWGGEEFVGVFEIKNDNEARMMAEKIRILVAKTEIPYEDTVLSVTASLGVTLAHEDDTIETVIARADSLMYVSKKNNKNCVTTDV